MPQDKTKPRTRTKVTTQTKHEDLATLLSKVLNHPELPPMLKQDIGESLSELFNSLSAAQQSSISDSTAYIAPLLAATAENEKGGAR